MERPRIAVIGAGLAGLTCARQLYEAGFQADIFDKGRGVSGRMSIRRIPASTQHPELFFDHGAQYFTARDPGFQQQVARWQQSGKVDIWQGPFVTLEQGNTGADPGPGDSRYVGVPGMNEICKSLAIDLSVSTSVRITNLEQTASGWKLHGEHPQTAQSVILPEEYRAVVCTIPAPQLCQLYPEMVAFRDQIKNVRLAPCRCLMLGFAEPLTVDFSGAFVQNSPLRWISRENSKPGRNRNAETWVLHASPEWSLKYVNDGAETVGPLLLAAFAEVLQQQLPAVLHSSAHGWLYAIPENPLGTGCLADDQLRLVAAGDWCTKSRVEGAWLSGIAAAHKILEWLS